MSNASEQWVDICAESDLVENSGVAALIDEKQAAIFYVPSAEQKIFAIGNFDPIGKAQVLSRGILGELKGDLVVASPLYKQHFRLIDGSCVEDDAMSTDHWECKLEAGRVKLKVA